MSQLLGLRQLPDKSGDWGILLPRQKEHIAAHVPAAHDAIGHIDPAALQFVGNDFDDMTRGYGVALGSFMALFSAISTLVLAPQLLSQDLAWVEFIVLPLLLVGTPIGFATWALRSARAPFREPFVLSRKLRRFYVWVDVRQGWRSWSYDGLIPFTQVNRLVTTAGASTIYALRLAVIDPETREIKETITPGPLSRTPESCGQLWEFIRRYMDGLPNELPPVRLLPGPAERAADLARFDRRFMAIVSPQHQIAPGILPKLFFWFWAVAEYWQMRAMAWVQRTAPRPERPAELNAALLWDGPNPYRVLESTDEELLARTGRLPRLRVRWQVAGILASLLYGSVFVAMTLGIVSTAWR